MKFQKLIVAIGAFALMTSGAQADVVWSTDIGNVIYEQDLPSHAVLSFPVMEGRGHAFIEGLQGNYYDRTGVFHGYWTEPMMEGADHGCPAMLTDQLGHTTNIWGRVIIVFHKADFPSGFSAIRGECLGEPEDQLNAYPVVADGVE